MLNNQTSNITKHPSFEYHCRLRGCTEPIQILWYFGSLHTLKKRLDIFWYLVACDSLEGQLCCYATLTSYRIPRPGTSFPCLFSNIVRKKPRSTTIYPRSSIIGSSSVVHYPYRVYCINYPWVSIFKPPPRRGTYYRG